MTDFRKLLALQPVKRRALPKPPLLTQHREALAPKVVQAVPAHRDGWGAVAAAVGLLSAAGLAVAVAARRGAQAG